MSKILGLLCDNTVDVLSKDELTARLELSLKNKKPLRIKAGFDPSSPDIHLGHTVLLRKLRQFQNLGHKVILIIGDYTAMIGDPTGKTITRPALSKKEVDKNAKTYQLQAFKILDKNSKKIEVVRNSRWLGKLKHSDFLENVAAYFTLAQIIQRDDFQKRMTENRPISFRELNYPLLQAYDSVMVRADIELGGTDQLFNLLAGRDLQPKFNQKPQVIMTLPLLVGLDGKQKMSKSLGNHIGVLDSSKDMFGKVMSIPDELMLSYFKLLTPPLAAQDHETLAAEIRDNPRLAKERLAKSIVSEYYSKSIGEKEAQEFNRVHRDQETPSDLPEYVLSEGKISIIDLMKKAQLILSNSEGRRLIEQNAVELAGEKVKDPQAVVEIKGGEVLRVGKKRFIKLVLSNKK